MKTLSVRDLRQRWPEAEALLRTEREVIITRDSKPVAKLVRFTAAKKLEAKDACLRAGGIEVHPRLC